MILLMQVHILLVTIRKMLEDSHLLKVNLIFMLHLQLQDIYR